jgi:tetratricopeptide (TPR) repeat protein
LGYSYPIWNLGQLYEQGFGVESSIDKAIELYIKACNTDFDPCPNAMYRMGYAYYDGYGVERNLEKAKEYFERAIKQGYHCSYALNMVKGELGELDDSNKMREYADGLIKKHIPNTKLYQQISKDLQNDFGDTWNITCRETKKFLETGMFTYFSLYSLGPHIYGNMDFSASITPMFKALEKELGKYLYSGYIEFLKKKEVSPNTFPQKRSFIKRINSTELAYRDSSDLTEFTLGNLHLTVGLERKPQFAENDTFKYTVDQTMLDYLNSIFKEDAFGEAKREREITDYIISLTQEVTSIADSLRNPAAHSETMKCQKAEACGNYIIKVQRLLIDFLEKVK